MTYTKREDLTARPGETVVELDDSGALVAVSCAIERSDTGVALHALARAINEDGTPVLDALLRPVETEYAHNVPVSLMDADMVRDCMRAVLGEPVERPTWSARGLAKASIRVSLEAAPLMGQFDAGSVL